ncbi:meiosis-specific nuclear structural protein 1-like [Dorcoceras hygrometricum]|uniref:Meiosis-specific nuclear structural protein 1-like n=1 Tax=Dorcoceras hygrometricum TaxID=472368 RepID=A0A2Z7AFL7_9LAMI|nr:meiosis-specific nuclear structural protein 1-like [Dorcoceras hygrometricum]
MDKATMLEAIKERKSKTKSGGASSSGAQNKNETSSGAPSKEKRKASPERKERRKKRHHEKRDTGSTQESIPEVTISELEDTSNKGPEQKSIKEPYTLLDASKISFVSNPSGSASLDFIRHMVPDQDFDQLKRTPDFEVFESVGLHFMQSLAWFGEAASRFSKAHAEVVKTKRSYDGVLGRHEALLKQLEEIQTKENVEKESLTAELESARAEAQTYKAQAQSLENQVQSLEIQVQYLDARVQCAEEESKLRLAEVEKLQEEKANSWALEKEKFLKSKDFDSLCLKKVVMYFDKGFEGCLAQFRATGFSEEEYPAPFLDVEQALADMPEDQEEGSSSPGEAPPA